VRELLAGSTLQLQAATASEHSNLVALPGDLLEFRSRADFSLLGYGPLLPSGIVANLPCASKAHLWCMLQRQWSRSTTWR
jgi:hypothetical protein